MGLSYSISDTLAGRSILGKTYRTTVPTALTYENGCYKLTHWSEHFWRECSVVRLPVGLKLQVINVTCSPLLTYQVEVQVKQNLPFEQASLWRVKTNPHRFRYYDAFTYVRSNYTSDKNLADLIEYEDKNEVLVLGNVTCRLNVAQFFEPIDKQRTIIPKGLSVVS